MSVPSYRDYHTPEAIAVRAAEHEAKRQAVDALKVDRDPCSYCGVRTDVGCRHSRRWAA